MKYTPREIQKKYDKKYFVFLEKKYKKYNKKYMKYMKYAS